MPVKKKAEGKKAAMKIGTLIEVVQKAAAELLLQAQDNIQQALTDSEDKKLTINLGVKVDESESEPLVSVGIRFSESYTDKRVTRLEDPNQIELFNELPKKPEAQVVGEGDKKKTGEGASSGGEE